MKKVKGVQILIYLFLLMLFLILTFTFSLVLVDAVVINEILPNPEEYSDAEWIELYSDETINLSGFKLDTTGQIYNFGNVIITDFLIITKNKTSFLLLWPNTPQDKIIEWTGMGLNNGGEAISLFNGSLLVDSTTYPSFSSKAGKSWARLINGTFIVCDMPTPNSQNNCSQQSQEKRIELIYPTEIQCNENFSITVEAYNFQDGIYDIKIDILDAYDESHRIGKVWNGTKWLSTNSYVNSILTISEGNGTATLIYKVEDFEGEAILRPRIRKSGSSSYEQFDDRYLEVKCEQAGLPKESKIKIIDAPRNAKFGDEIEVELEVYKGDTIKYAVYVYVQDNNEEKVSDKITLHFNEKFITYKETINLNLKCKNEKGIYEIVAEGLDSLDKKEIELSECKNITENADEGVSIGDFTYFINVPNTIYLKEPFEIKIKIMSRADKEQEFLVWSYVYRGSVCYSCSNSESRESNVKSIVVQPNFFVEVALQNIVQEAEEGNYKIKIKIQQQGLKTPKEFSYDVFLIDKDKQNNAKKEYSSYSSTIYQNYSQYSQPIKTKSSSLLEILPYLLVSVALLLAIYLVINKI
ncbi:MAG: lamin tail domain-containing protein [Candidatus Pacearchaeota archaeon]